MEFSLEHLQPKERASFALRSLYETAGCRKYHMGRFEEYSLYQENRSNWLIQTAQQRQLATKRSAKLNMRQQTIYDLSEAPEKISGWLTTLGWK